MQPHASFTTPLRTAPALFLGLATFAITARAEIPLKANDTVLFYGGGMVERLGENGEMEARIQLARPELKLCFRSLAWTGDEVGHRQRPEGYVEHLKNLLAKWPDHALRFQQNGERRTAASTQTR